eukprot:TCALIF_08275-PA protein Name:"Protein of unknown function" AED:0.14 eAED:0.14 QI:1/0.66/0.25/1/1/1/4/160/593
MAHADEAVNLDDPDDHPLPPHPPAPDPNDVDSEASEGEEEGPFDHVNTDEDEADEESEDQGPFHYMLYQDDPSQNQHHFSLTPKGKKLQGGSDRLRSLVELSIGTWLKSTKDFTAFERELATSVPHTLFRQMFSVAMTLKRFRPYLIQKILRHWPFMTLGIGSADNELYNHEDNALNFEMGGPNEDDEYRFSKRIMTVVDLFIHSLSQGQNKNLKRLKLHATPECDTYYSFLRKCLRRHKGLLRDLEKVDPDYGIEVIGDLTSGSDRSFWFDFLAKVPRFLRANTNRTDRDGVRTFISQLYGPEHYHHPWLRTIQKCQNLQTLSLWYSTKVPENERNGYRFDHIPRETREPSPCAIHSWKEVLKHLPRLKFLYLGGNCVTNCLEELLGNVPFSLTSLNVEGSRLAAKDYEFLANSKHAQTITDISLGDFDLGTKFDSIMLVLKSLEKIESLDLCMDGYERYIDDHCITDSLMNKIVSFLHDFHLRSLKFVSFAGHNISENALVSIARILVRFPELTDFILPVEGFSAAAQDWFDTNVKLPFAGGSYPQESLDEKSPDELRRVVKSIEREIRSVGRPLWRYAHKNIRDGIRITL